MVFEPKHELPVTAPGSSDPWPSNLQLPIQTRSVIQASPQWFDYTQNQSAAADGIVDYYSSSIAHFVQAQRRSYAAGMSTVHNRSQTLPGLGLKYENYFGQERLTMTVYPESFTGGGRDQEFNYDGYVMFMLYDPKYPNTVNGKDGYPGAYDIYMNGYLIKQNWPIKGPVQTFVIMFGPTALRCQSLVDAQHLNPFENMGGGLTQKVLPPRPQVDGHDDLPAYLLFDFTTTMNPVYTPQDMMIVGGTETVKCNVTEGIQFFDPRNSPLNTKKGTSINYSGVKLSYGLTQGAEDPIDYIWFAEFYSRTKARGVSQSWTKVAQPASALVANDKPLYWGAQAITAYTGVNPGQNGFGFDLFDESGGAMDNLAPISLTASAGGNAPFGNSIPPAQDDILIAYQAAVEAAEIAFDQSQAPAVDDALAAQLAARLTYDDDNLLWLKAKLDLVNLDDQILAYEQLDPTIYGLVLAIDIANVPVFKQNIQTAADTRDDALAKLSTADEALDAIFAEVPPLPPAPHIKGDDINKFKYRTVTVSGDDWMFGDWQGG